MLSNENCVTVSKMEAESRILIGAWCFVDGQSGAYNIKTSVWCSKPFNQWQCSFQMKAALPLVNWLVTASDTVVRQALTYCLMPRWDGYPLCIISPIYRLQLTLRKNISKRNTKTWGHPFSWLVIGDSNSTSVYNDSKYLISSLAEIEPHTAITNKPEESKEKR